MKINPNFKITAFWLHSKLDIFLWTDMWWLLNVALCNEKLQKLWHEQDHTSFLIISLRTHKPQMPTHFLHIIFLLYLPNRYLRFRLLISYFYFRSGHWATINVTTLLWRSTLAMAFSRIFLKVFYKFMLMLIIVCFHAGLMDLWKFVSYQIEILLLVQFRMNLIKMFSVQSI